MKNDDWKIELMRLTIFVEDDFNSKNLEDWLIKISGHDPIQINKKETTFLGISKLESSFLKLELKQNRINLILNPDTPDIENNIGDFSMFDNYCKEYFLKYFDMDGCPFSNRIALGVILNIPIKDNADGLEILKRYLKSVKITDGVSDFLYRTNIPLKPVKSNEIEINRLVTWHVGEVKILTIDIDRHVLNELNEGDSKLFCRVEMDLNTTKNTKIKMPVVQQKDVLTTLIDIAKGIAESGENSF